MNFKIFGKQVKVGETFSRYVETSLKQTIHNVSTFKTWHFLNITYFFFSSFCINNITRLIGIYFQYVYVFKHKFKINKSKDLYSVNLTLEAWKI